MANALVGRANPQTGSVTARPSDEYASLQIELDRTEDGRYKVELEFEDPMSEAVISPLDGLCAPAIDNLLELQLDYPAYGKALFSRLFADENVLGMYRQAEAAVGASPDLRGLRIQLLIRERAHKLNALHWELLTDPKTSVRLGTSEKILFSRFIFSQDWGRVPSRRYEDLTALIAVSGPPDIERYKLAKVNVACEVKLAQSGLKKLNKNNVRVAGEKKPLTLPCLMEAMRERVDVLYLVCHGFMKDGEEPYLFFHSEDGIHLVKGAEFALAVGELREPPRLAVLASCDSAGVGDDVPAAIQASLAPLLAQAGVPAVIAMQGKISMKTVNRAMPKFFSELLKEDGPIERAMAVARAHVLDRPDYWRPALFSRLKSGRLWSET